MIVSFQTKNSSKSPFFIWAQLRLVLVRNVVQIPLSSFLQEQCLETTLAAVYFQGKSLSKL